MPLLIFLVLSSNKVLFCQLCCCCFNSLVHLTACASCSVGFHCTNVTVFSDRNNYSHLPQLSKLLLQLGASTLSSQAPTAKRAMDCLREQSVLENATAEEKSLT